MSNKSFIPVGNQTSFSAARLTDPFQYALIHGFDAFEWFPDRRPSGEGWDIDVFSAEDRHQLRQTSIDRGIRISVHAPCDVSPLTSEGLAILMDHVVFARDVGAIILNIHLRLDHGVEAYVNSLQPLLDRLSQVGQSDASFSGNLRLSIENTPQTTPQDFNHLFDKLCSLGYIDGMCVGMCFDMGHANICSETRNDYLRYFDMLLAHVPIIHLHAHENHGDADSHLTLFTGPSALDPSGVYGLVRRLKERGFPGAVIMEQWPSPPTFLISARARLIEIIESMGPVASQPEQKQNEAAAGPEGSDFDQTIARAARQNTSWRTRLAWVLEHFETKAGAVSNDELAYIAVFLRFIGSGELACAEDGGHHRPSNHANISSRLYKLLRNVESSKNAFIIRRIYPWLPSYNSAFIRSEPLTRIRDIAHRNDIPKDLKQEIKHSLQNKLHRCAGPEDLVTSARLLARLQAPDAKYTSGFVREFRKFHEELKEFFNARSLDEDMASIAAATPNLEFKGEIEAFLQAKNQVAQANEAEPLSGLLQRLTSVRRLIVSEIGNNTDSTAHCLHIADIRLEGFLFVLLSRLSAHFSSATQRFPWQLVMHCLVDAMENLRFSGFDEDRCRSIEHELLDLASGSTQLLPKDLDMLLRLKAASERGQRLIDEYGANLIAFFARRVEHLGRALGIDDQCVKTFCEAEIRSHMVFPLSGIISTVLRQVRFEAGMPAWDIIAPGTAQGRLVVQDSFEDAAMLGYTCPVIVVAKKLTGYEEITTTLAGVIVAHQTPYLSHFAVRIRKARIPFVASEDQEILKSIMSLDRQMVSFECSPARVIVRPVNDVDDNQGFALKKIPDAEPLSLPVVLAQTPSLVSLNSITPAIGGAKADGARRLAELAKDSGAEFLVPPAVVVPFGVMELYLSRDLAKHKTYLDAVACLDTAAQDQIDHQINHQIDQMDQLQDLAIQDLAIQDLVMSVQLDETFLLDIKRRFKGRGTRLMVRSSANCEDLAGVASEAGIYDSVANVSAASGLEIAQAIRQVWASLWTRRAVLSRRRLGIGQKLTSMAVLIQQMVVPDVSFILYTSNPLTGDAREVFVELAVGHGQSLASQKEPGAPYRMTCGKRGVPQVRMLSFSSIDYGWWPGSGKGAGLERRPIDYSQVRLSFDTEYRRELGARLVRIAQRVEQAFGCAQDIEGLIFEDKIYLVQARPA